MLHRTLSRRISGLLLGAALTAGAAISASEGLVQPVGPAADTAGKFMIPLAFSPLQKAGYFEASSPRHRMLVTPEGLWVRHGGQQMQLRWLGAKRVMPQAGERSATQLRDLTPARSNGLRYGQVRMAGLYAGVDAVLYAQGSNLELDYVVAPKANADQVQFALEGQSKVELTAAGEITFTLDGQPFRLSRPVAYQVREGKRTSVTAAFRALGGNRFGFNLGAYDRTLPLVIDPVLQYASFVGGFGFDTVNALAVGPDGTVWVAGTTNSRDFPQVGEIPTQAATGSRDVWVARFDPTKSGEASLLYAAYIGGGGVDEARALVVEQGGTVMVGGQTASNGSVDATQVFPSVGGLKTTFAGTTEGFLVRLDPTKAGTETLTFATVLGGDGDDAVTALAVAANGRVAIAGTTTGSGFPVTSSPVQASGQGGSECFIGLVDPGASAIVYATYLGGSSTDIPTRIALNSQGHLYVTGYTNSANFPIAGDSYRGDMQGKGDIFLARINPSVAGLEGLLYGTYFGGSDLDFAHGLVVEADNVVSISGYTLSSDLPTAGNGVQRSYRGAGDGFVATLNVALPGSAKLTYATYYGGAGTDVIYGLVRDRNTGRLLFTGYTYSADFPTSNNGLQKSIGGAYDAFVAALAPNQPAVDGIFYSSFWGAAGLESGNAVALDSTGCILYVGGNASDPSAPLSNSAYSKEIKGYLDAFLSATDVCR